MKKLEITEENLQKAHEDGCSDVKKALENMFPEVFESLKKFNLSKLKLREDISGGFIFTCESSKEAGFSHEMFIKIRSGGKYDNKGFYLNDDYNWRIEEEKESLCLIPTKK